MESSPSPARGYSSLLVPVDFAGCAFEVVLHARRLAAAFHAEVNLAYVISLPVGTHPDDPRGESTVGAVLMAEAHAELTGLARQFEAPERVRLVIRFGAVLPTLLELIRETRADLVIMGTHGRSGLRRLVLGSVAEQVIRAGLAPVLTVHAPAGTADAHGATWDAVAADRDG